MRKLSIKESMDTSIPDWLRPSLSLLGKPVNGRYTKGPGPFSRKVDIANTTYTELPIPRTSNEFNTLNKDPNRVTVIQLEPEYGDRPVVWMPGYLNDEKRIDWEHNYKARELQRTAVKKILPHVISYGYLTIDPEGLKAKRTARAGSPEDRYSKAQYLSVDKDVQSKWDSYWDKDGEYHSGNLYQGPARQTWKTMSGYDKSGYKITGLEKYRKMLADMGIDNYENVMDETLSVYEEFATMPRKIRGNSRLFELYTRIGYSFMQVLDRVDRAYKDYISTKKSAEKYGFDPDEDAWAKKNLRSIMNWVKQDVDRMKLLIAIANGEQELDDTNERKLYH